MVDSKIEDLKVYLKNNKLFSVIIIFFIAWVTFLLIFSNIYPGRQIIFWDALFNVDASSQYTSTIPIMRYIFEPFIAITFMILNVYTIITIIIFIITIYIFIRLGLYVAHNKNLIEDGKYSQISLMIQEFFSFGFKACGIIIIGILAFLGIGYLIGGFLFLNGQWQLTLQIAFVIGFCIMGGKLIIMLIRYFHPNLKLKLKNRINNTKFKIFKREFYYFTGYFILIVGIIFLSQAIPFPTQQIQSDVAADEFLFDFHVHTYMSDGFLSPEERVLWYVQQGIHGAAFTDHENQRGALIAQRFVDQYNILSNKGTKFKVLIGQEYTYHDLDIHLNYFDVEEIIVPPDKNQIPGVLVMNVSDMIAYVHSKGGWVIVNHYTVNGTGPYTYEQLRDWGVDGFEIINSGTEYPTANPGAIRDFCLANNLICMAGSDIHTNLEIHSFIKLKLNNPSNLSTDNIFQHLQNNTHNCVYIQLNPKRIILPEILTFFQDLGNYFLNLDVFQLLSWIGWSTGFFLIFFVLYKKLKSVDPEKMKDKTEIIE
ncbi:MAG: PHP domain-containing protein [Candidatus Lokiarchaeota archaeon]|nr:PHP domain-containing protein [Candidatus Lokiarchaeota archaeon]